MGIMGIEIDAGSVRLSQFAAADARDLYCIRNHPTVRRFMSDPRLIPYRSHVRWVSERLLADANHLLFLVRLRSGSRAVGLTQLRIAGDTAEIGVMFREPGRHQVVTFVATVATLHVAFDQLGLKWLISYVLPAYDAAIEFNKGFGAWEEPSDKPGMVKLRLSAEVCRQNENFRRVLDRMKGRLHVRRRP